MAQQAQCLLPSFGTTSDGPKRPVSITTKTTPSQSAKLLSAYKNYTLDPLLKTAWGLLLYRYTGLQDVCFGYKHDDAGALVSQTSDAGRLLTFKLTINEHDTIKTLLEKSGGGYGCQTDIGMGGSSNANNDKYSSFNTVVMVRVCGDSTKEETFVRPVIPSILPEECRARLHVKVLQEDICIFLEWWNTDISTAQMESVARYFEHILNQVLYSDDTVAADADCFLEQDWARICKFNSVIPEIYDRCIHDVVSEQARLHPQREAVCAWDGSLTYGELDVLASELSYRLKGYGVRPETFVALCFDKSKWNIVAMLGVLKAGGAFVPLDPTHPTPRLRSLVDSVNVNIMLCSRDRAEHLSTVVNNLIPLDEQSFGEISFLPGRYLRQEVESNNAAYLIFTSGSTGKPKGTLLEHRAFVSCAFAYGAPMGLNADTRILQFAAHTFDASLCESLAPLIHGGCVCVPSEEERLNDIVQAINRMNVNFICLTPSFARFINPSSIPQVNTALLVGEAMSRTDLEAWSHIKLLNGYGPTEAAVCAAINSTMDINSDCRDIGLATGTHFWVVNPNNHNQLVPVGCPGELLLEGPTLARCYINNPEKTDDVFIYNPTWARHDPKRGDRRFYKTGDLVRYNSDLGSLTFLGRKDSQIKLHGQRIELGEVEHNLSTLPLVKHGMAFLCESGPAKGKLMAVVSLNGELSSNTVPFKLLPPSERTYAVTELRQQLSKRLPTYMIPAVWLCVQALPLLPSGKLNRREIISWATNKTDDFQGGASESSGVETPKTTHSEVTVEDRLTSIWSRVLAIPRDRISLEESFLALGGDSIAAITCMGYCKKQGMGVTVQDVLQSKSIRDLVTRVQEIKQLVKYQEETGEPFGLSPIQKLHFMIRKEGQGYFNQSVRTRLSRRLSADDLGHAIQVIIERHSMLRVRLIEDTLMGTLRQRITRDIDSSYRLRVHNINQQAQMESAISASQLCINAFEGPIMAVDIFYTEDDCFLSMVAHHLAIDIVSWRIILEDLEDILLRPEDKIIHTSSLPFSTWCHLQDERTQTFGSYLEDLPIPDAAYWGIENRVATYGDAICETFELGLDDSKSILMECHKSLATEPVDILLASLLHAFGQTFTDRSLPAIYNEGHGREAWDSSIDISRTVGWFTTVFPIFIREQVPDDPVETVVLVKDIRRSVSDNGRQRFASLMSASTKDEKRGFLCPMEISFNYVGQHRDLQRQDGLFQLMNQMAGETGQGGGASDFGKETPRFGLFEISALAVNGRLRFIFSFSKYMRHQERIRAWIASCGDVLRSLGKRLQTHAKRPTLSDFPMLSLTYPDLESMLAKTLPGLGVNSPELIEDIYPCSRMQQGILLARSRDSSLYAVHDTYEVRGLNGKPDVARLAEAWRMVVSRHAMLRTLFVENLTSRDLFSQLVLRNCEPSIFYLSCSTDDDVVSTFNNQCPEIYNEYKPHHRLTFCETASGRVFFRLELSHAAMDGVSISVILRDLQLAYDGKLDQNKPLFKNYIQYLRNTPQDASIAYWKNYLADVKPCLFPTLTDGKIIAQKQLKVLRPNFNLFNDLQTVCEERRLTLSSAFTAAWGLTLSLFCGLNDVCFSYMTSLRDSRVDDIESVVGPVINLLACRVKISKGDTLRDIMQKVQNDCMEQLAYNTLSFIDIAHELRLSEQALINTGISYQRVTKMQMQPTTGISLSRVCAIQDPAEYPLFVNVVASDKAAEIEVNYWTNTLSDEQAENVSSTFLKCLENIVRHLKEQVGQLEVLSDWNKQRIRKWNKQLPEEIDMLVQDIIQEKMASQPDTPAVIAWDGTLTYAELEHLSSCFAAYLQQLGVRPGTLVPVYLGKSVWQIVAILAVFKTGAICVPRDEAQLGGSLDRWLVDHGAHIVVTLPSLAGSLERQFPLVVPINKSLFEFLPSSSGENLPQVHPHDDSFIAFDSSDPHESAAVVLDQRAIIARAAAFASTINSNSGTKTFQYAPCTSDMFLQEAMGTFMSGGCLCIPRSDSLSQLSRSINETNANLICLTPLVASFIRPSDVPSIQVLVLFGEQSTRNVKKIWSEKVQLYAFYGRTECSSTCIQVSRPDDLGTLSSIGTRVGCCSWVVDPQDFTRLVPVGCIGELIIEGPSVSRGYLCHEKQTKERFIEQDHGFLEPAKRPYTLFPGSRRKMFRTGYLVRYNADGALVYLGEKDNSMDQTLQMIALKIEQLLDAQGSAGYRCVVETLDLRIEEYPEPCSAVFILSTEDQQSSTMKHSTVIAQKTNNSHMLMAKLHASLAASLPASQVPSLYFPIFGLPMTSLGKVNRPLLRNAVKSLSADSLTEYDLKKFGEFWRHQLEKPSLSGQLLLQPFPVQGSPTLKTVDKGMRIPWGGSLQRPEARAVLLCAWALAIYSYTQRDDIILGELLVNAKENSNSAEHFLPQATMIPRRVQVDNSITISGLLDQTVSCLVKARPYEKTPLSSIRSLNADTSQASDFESALSISSMTSQQQSQYLGSLETEEHLHSRLSVCPIVVFCALEETGVHLEVRYDDRAIYRSQADRLLALIGECLNIFRSTTGLEEKVADLSKRGGNLQIFNDTIDYWKVQLTDIESCLFPDLSPKKGESRLSTERLRLSNASKIQSACKALSINPDILLQTVWALVLRCYTGLEDVCFGYHVSTKKDSVDILPCRFNLNDDLRLRDVMQKRKEDMESVSKYQMPLFEILRAIGSENSPVFNTAFRYRKSSSDAAVFNNAILDPVNEGLNEYLISVNASVSSSSAEISFDYQSTSLSETDIGHIIDCFECTLNSILTLLGPNRVIRDVEFFGRQSCQKVSAWNASLPERPKRCAHAIIQDRVIAQPSAPAICSWDENFTYSELDSLTTKLAYHLMDWGVGPEVFVGLCFEKSAWAVIAQVAVLKAGGAFASLDPAHPESRLRGLVDDIAAPIVLCSTRYLDKSSKICKAALAVSHYTLEQIPDLPATRSLPTLSVENAAYAIFTSGTTGKPKITVLEHAALDVASSCFAKTLGFDSNTRALQFSSYTFDVSILETIITLMTGGCVCTPSDDERMNDLAGAIERMEANSISCTPSIISTLDPSSVPTLKTIFTGGEKLTEAQIMRWADRRFYNAYGPSEATIIATASMKVNRDGIRLDDDCNSIGTAVCGRAWIVDPYNHHRLLPVGAVGELVLEGYNIARGYLNNDKKTKEVFITLPRWFRNPGLRDVPKPTGRMYRTGDLVRYKSDKNICFISRMDTQVKLNGQRIELEEIEQQCTFISPANTQVAVDIVVPETKTVAKALAAFITIAGHEAQNAAPGLGVSSSLLLPLSDSIQRTIGQLHNSLGQVLPQVMIPRLYFPVRYLPLGTTGKLDRKGLRAMVQALPKEQLISYMISNAGSGRAVERAAESTLRDLWAKALEIEPGSISAEDSFFGLGGDSFAAMKLVGAARSQNISLSFATIYEHPVLVDMAKCCDDAEKPADRQRADLRPFTLVPGSIPLHDIMEEVSEQCSVTKDSIADIYPCTAVQEGLLTLSIKSPGSYVARIPYRLAATVDLQRFKAAWQQVTEEFDILRTRIVHIENTGFLQVVLKKEKISWTLETSLDNVTDDTAEGSGALLAKYAIVQLGPDVRYFVWTVNHALYDGWNVPQIMKRVEDVYTGFSVENPAVPYKLFIHHLLQRDMQQSDEFWKSYLDGLSCEPFPPKRNKELSCSGAGSIHRASVDISRKVGATDTTVPELVRSAWAIVLSVHTGSGDVCFGETLMGRNIDMPGITDVAGPVLTTVPMRIRVDNKLPINQYLRDVRQIITTMIPHQHSGLQRIQKLSGEAALACNFQNLLVIQSDDSQLNDDIWSLVEQDTRGDFFTHPLVVQCQITGPRLLIHANYDELVLDDWQTERLIGQFSFVLEQLLSVPRDSLMTVGDIDITGPLDKRDIASWNQRQVTCVNKCVHEIIRENAIMHPQAPAICSWDGEITYEEMFQLASSFAAYLVTCGVGPETLVPVCLGKSLWTMVTVLSVLLAGGAFVPLDPSHPTSRHKEILEEIEADMILCSPQLRSRYLGSVSTIIPVSEDTIKAYSTVTTSEKTNATPTPENMAYAIFTSGSTGRPKGIIIEHRAVCSSVIGFAPVVELNKDSRVFQFASLTFDAAILEVLGTLMLGGCICVPSDDERLNDIPGAMQRMNVSWSFLTPSVACILEPSTVPSLQILTCGGEALSSEVVKKWTGHVKFFGGYGPTETVVFAVVARDFVDHGFTCIGYGVPSTLTWVVQPDDHDRLAPLGAVGELVLEGPALAREYLKNPTKTTDVFINEPAWIKNFPSSLPSPRRIYKTGDLVRYNSDGSIEYLGRKDHQVKLHGQRMELGEIEHRLLASENIRNAVVILPQKGPLRQKLVAVLSLKSLTADSSTIMAGACELASQNDMLETGYRQIRASQKSIEEQLPVYMVPQAWAVVKNIPMLVSGKLDRKRISTWLEQLDKSAYDRIMQDYDDVGQVIVEEENKGEREGDAIPAIIRDIFAQVLNLPINKVDPSRSFIYLGGDSISGMAVVSKARKRGLNLPLNRILQAKSIEELAVSCGTKPLPTKNVKESGSLFPLSPIQQLFFRSASVLPKASGRLNQSITVRLARRTEPNVLEDAVRAVVQKHAMFRARFSKSSDGTWWQRITDEVDSSYKFCTHPVKNAGNMSSIIADTQSSLDIQRGPVIAADLLDKKGEQILFLVASHVCVDVVSWRIVLQELEEFVDTGSIPSDVPLSFQSWCNVQFEESKRFNKSIEIPCQQADLNYWGMSRAPNNYGHVKMDSFALDKQATAFISGHFHEILRTETMEVLLAAVMCSFNRVFPDRDAPTIYNEGHGREPWNYSDPSGTIGWFTTLSPLHVGASSDLLELLKQVKDTRRRISEHSRAFFAHNVLHSDSTDKTHMFSVPLEILFNYLGQLQQLERDGSTFQHYGDVFSAETMDSASDMGPETPRFSLFEITALIVKEQLHISFTYNRNMRHQARIQAWMAECKRVLEVELPKFRNVAPQPTLTDYPLLPITYHGLQELTASVLPRLGLESWLQVEDIYPCSPIQEGILFSQLRDPHEYIFNAIFELRQSGNEGNIDLARLKKAWSTVVARHPVLRTVFIDSCCEEGSFDQIVLKEASDATVVIECDDLDALNKLEAVSLRSNKSSNLYHQLVLCKTSTGRVLMKLEMNHVIIDGGSTSILLRELALAYSNQHPPGPGPLFSEYIKYLREESTAEALEYWKRRLSDVRPCHLPVKASENGARQLGTHLVAFNRFAALQNFCEANSITFANLILAAWAIVLRSHTKSDDVCFGYPSTGRDLPVPGIQDAVGIFINTLCCRVRFDTNQTLEDTVKTVQEDHIASLAHQRSSLAEIQHALGRKGEPLFNTCISIQNRSEDKAEIAGISYEFQKAHDPCEYPLTLNVESARGYEGILLRYWADAVSETEAAAFARDIAKVLTCFLEDSSMPVSNVKVRDEEKAAITAQFMDRGIIENIVDERIKTVISQMLGKGKPVTSWVKSHSAESLSDFPDIGNGVEESLQDLVVMMEKTPASSTQTLNTDYRAPNHSEKQLWRLWSITLGLPPHPVKYHDSFFKLGGDSITAMRLVRAARDEGLKLSVADVLKNPVFENMMAVINDRKKPNPSTVTEKRADSIEKRVEDKPMLPRCESSQEISILRPMSLEFDDTSLRAAISPKVGVFKGGIVDVLPVTDFQALSLTATMFESRWMLNYFYLNGKGSLDIRRLRESFLRVVDAFDILRTVFVCFHGQFYQVVLRKIKPDIFVHETEKCLDEYTNSLQQRDREQSPGQGQQCVQFYVVRRINSDEHRILVRMSHAQFDGVCLSKIMTAIKMAYEGSPVSPSSFLNYMRLLPGNITPEHYQHWGNLLKGSKMTQIVQRDRPNTFQHIGGFTQQSKVIEIPSTATENVTIATVMQSAWAVTLAKICAQDDVVFGLTVNGRNAVPGAENTIGPCLNFIPIRVTFKDRWTGLDLFRFLQDQQVANMTYESLGFREIVRRCTDWPESTFFTTSVLHQNVDYEGHMQLDNNTYKMGGVGVIDNLTDLTLFSKPVAGQPTQINVALGYSTKGPIHPSFVSTVLDMVCDTAQSLVANPNVALPSPSTIRSLPPQLVEDIPTTGSTDSLLSSLNNHSLSEILAHSDLITRIWQQVLPPRLNTGKPPSSYQLDSSFFGLGGDIVNVAQVVWILEQETGLHIRLEDLLAHSTFLGHMAVLALNMTKRDSAGVDSDTAPAPAYAPVDARASRNVSTSRQRQEGLPLPAANVKSEWSALDRARVLAKKITRLGGLGTRV
ncbi:nonribosomal peptide synthase Pes1 [Aspergillus foveolatus]|uniref:nonribosomal peptide synthase Pes1 n=1 Tax=Aspergillus foveolatus TaxID=210207 RepID=UPI003CCD813C